MLLLLTCDRMVRSPCTQGSTLQHTATHCNTLQHTATHCNTLQHTATHLQNTATHSTWQRSHGEEASTAKITHCNTLQHTETHCNTLAKHCNTLYLTAIVWWGSFYSQNNTLQHTTTLWNRLQHTLQHTATQSTCQQSYGEEPLQPKCWFLRQMKSKPRILGRKTDETTNEFPCKACICVCM